MKQNHYTIKIQGHLDPLRGDSLYGMTVTHQVHSAPTSVLYGDFDQSALLGALYQLHNLNVTILMVTCDSKLETAKSSPIPPSADHERVDKQP